MFQLIQEVAAVKQSGFLALGIEYLQFFLQFLLGF